jgi:cytochrome c-type biogenesis protein CcmH
MMFWVIATLMALGSSGIIAAALLRGQADAAPAAAYDLDVYRVQLNDVDKDLARGVISEGEAERLRTEVSRRVLAADAQLRQEHAQDRQPRRAGLLLAAGLALVVTGGALAGYHMLGAPGYGDMPRAARLAASDANRANRLTQTAAVARFGTPETPITPPEDYAQLIRQLRAAVESRPDDLRGLALLVRNEAGLGNTSAAIKAQTHLIALKGADASAGDHAMLADLLITAAGGYVSQEAEAELRAALLKDPEQPEARYYLGLYYNQVDRPDAAFRTWERLLTDSAPGAVWVAPLRAQIVDAAQRAGIRYTLPPVEEAPGPDAADIKAAKDMTDEERQNMIHAMVDGLMARLADKGGPPEEWARLITALGVLGNTERAAAIAAEAAQTFNGDAEALAAIRAAARRAGVAQGAASGGTGE